MLFHASYPMNPLKIIHRETRQFIISFHLSLHETIYELTFLKKLKTSNVALPLNYDKKNNVQENWPTMMPKDIQWTTHPTHDVVEYSTTHRHAPSLPLAIKQPTTPIFCGRPPNKHLPTSLKLTVATDHRCQAQRRAPPTFNHEPSPCFIATTMIRNATPSGRERLQ